MTAENIAITCRLRVHRIYRSSNQYHVKDGSPCTVVVVLTRYAWSPRVHSHAVHYRVAYKSCARFDFGNSTVGHDWLVNGTEITTANRNARYKERDTTYDVVVNPVRASAAGVAAIFSVGQPERKTVAVGSK